MFASTRGPLAALARRHGVLVAAVGAAATAGQAAAADEGEIATANLPSFREQVIGSYENRIRNFSAPERVFEFFASVTTEDGTFMTPEDFVRALTPFQQRAGAEVGSKNFKFNFQAKFAKPAPAQAAEYAELVREVLADAKVTPEECRRLVAARHELGIDAETHLEALAAAGVTNAQLEELIEARGGIPRRAFFAMVDMDGDGLISYSEYMLFHTLLAIPHHRLRTAFRMFDRDESGSIDLYEFEKFMAVLRASTNAGQKEVSRLHKTSDLNTYRSLFGSDGGGQLSLARFGAFARTLRLETLRLQFHAWDDDRSGKLSGAEFARFLVSMISTDRPLQRRFLERSLSPAVRSLAVDISTDEFLAFHEFLHHLESMKVAMRVLGSNLTKEDFLVAAAAAVRQAAALAAPAAAAAAAAASAGVTTSEVDTDAGGEEDDAVEPGISPAVAEVLFALFDANGDGRLDFKEFASVMEQQDSSTDPPRDIGFMRWLETVIRCGRREIV